MFPHGLCKSTDEHLEARYPEAGTEDEKHVGLVREVELGFGRGRQSRGSL